MLTAIDTDPGIDDALALLLAWGSPELRVEIVTTVAGNVEVATATTNALRLVAVREPDPRPLVVAGAAGPLARPLRTAKGYHGDDGLGDVPDWPRVDTTTVRRNAADTLVGAARRDGSRLTLVAVGPITNVAMAVNADREAMRRVKRIVWMGGAVDVPGNVTPTAEFNAFVDPEAAALVLDAGLAIDVVPLDATRQAALPRSDFDAALARSASPLAKRIAAFTERGFRVDAARGSAGILLHDPLAVGVAIDPTLVTWEPVRLEVARGGETRRAAGASNCRIARAVDRRRFFRMFLERVCP